MTYTDQGTKVGGGLDWLPLAMANGMEWAAQCRRFEPLYRWRFSFGAFVCAVLYRIGFIVGKFHAPGWATGRRIAAVLIAAGLAASYQPVTLAGDPGSVEVSVATAAVNAEASEIDGTGMAYSAGWVKPLSKLGLFSGRMDLTRVDGVGSAAAGAWNVALGGQFNFGDATDADGDRPGAFQGFVRGALGMTFQDARTMTETAPVVPAPVVPAPVPPGLHQAPAAAPQMVEVDVDVAEQYVAASVAAGARFYFDKPHTLGFGVEAAYSVPMNAGLDVDNARNVRVFLIIPAGQ